MKFFTTILLTLLMAFCTTAQAYDIDGGWYDPGEAGYGVFFDSEVSTGTFMAFFTYEFFTEAPGQAWYVGYVEGANDGDTFEAEFLGSRAVGVFPASPQETLTPTLVFTVTSIDADTILVDWHFVQEPPCLSPRVSPSPPFCDGQAVFVRLLPDVEVPE